MRRIPQQRLARHIAADWILEARGLAKSMIAMTPRERAATIKKHATLWSKIKKTLWILGGDKCWYSEVVLSIGEVEVEHFRPKRKLSGDSFAGYWWLAFDWRNYRIASSLVNKRRMSELSEALRGKGSYFPLAGGTRGSFMENPPASDPLGVASEQPLLLDPIDMWDVSLLTFDQDGLAIPNSATCKTAIQTLRVEKSVEFYSLDDGVLSARRAEIWKSVLEWSEEIEEVLKAEEDGKLAKEQAERFKQLSNQIGDAIDVSAEFTSVAIAALRLRGNRGWNTAMLGAVAQEQ